jgi:uncharacterized protein YecT (DUF1311 family)
LTRIAHYSPILLLCAIVAWAGDVRALEEGECDMPSNVEISHCLGGLLTRDDAVLNRVYKQAMASIDTDDYMEPSDRETWKKTLRNAQRAWIAFKEIDCGELIFYEWWGGTGSGIAALACKIDLTRSRTADLTARYELE